jgi:hypothetical protein
VLNDDAVEREKRQSPAIDEIPISLADLERVDRHGTADWSFRWSFAYAQVLRDETLGLVTHAVRRQETRALKNHSDGRMLETRLDAAESPGNGCSTWCSRWPAACGPTTSTCPGSSASTRWPCPSGRPRRSCPSWS